MNRNLKTLLDGMAGKRVVVWGDLAADHTVYGETSRISREAPVLILEKEWDTVQPGCAGNAVANVLSLGGVPVPVGVLGEDPMGDRLLQEFEERGIETTHIVRRGKTAVKMRVLAGGLHTVKQQVIRIDSGGGYPSLTNSEVEDSLRAALRDADAVIVSDYALGTVRPSVFASVLRSEAIPSVIDSRHALREFKRAHSATPNEPELEEVTGVRIGEEDDALDDAGSQLLEELELKALLVTRGKRGMALFEHGKGRLDIPVARVQEIVDVTGAGDTVIATYTMALAAGADFAAAARLANVAAGLAVMKRGPAAPAAAELRAALV